MPTIFKGLVLGIKGERKVDRKTKTPNLADTQIDVLLSYWESDRVQKEGGRRPVMGCFLEEATHFMYRFYLTFVHLFRAGLFSLP